MKNKNHVTEFTWLCQNQNIVLLWLAKIFILDKRLKHSHTDNYCTQAGEV